MTVTYLNQPVASPAFDVNGNATATFQVPTGSFLVPRFVRVTTNQQTTPVARCTLYIGAVTVTSVGTYVDDTVQGNGDTTSAIAGNIAKTGDAITAVWTGGNPGDTGVLNIVGLYTDTLPEALAYLTTPGNRFVGHSAIEFLSVAAKVPFGSPQNLLPGNVTIGPFDVRGFASWYLKVSMKTAGAATAFNVAQIGISWLSGPIGSAIDILFQDTLTFFADSPSGTFAFNGGLMELQDSHHGPYFLVTFFNNAVTDTLQLSYTLEFTSRVLPAPFYRQATATDGKLFDVDLQALVAGVGSIPLPFTYGPVELVLANHSATNSMQFSLVFGTTTVVGGGNGFIATIAAGMSQGVNPRILVTFPKRSGFIQVTGTGTDQFGVRAISLFSKV